MTHSLDSFNLDPTHAALVVIDVQEKLLTAMHPQVQESVLLNAGRLIKGSRSLGVSAVVTEQYPKGLGHTAPSLLGALGDSVTPVEKIHFDCTGAETFDLGEAKTAILCGMEAHICVLQTALGLRRAGLGVWVAQDAVCSRTQENWRAALRLMGEAGVVVAPTEAILFMMLGKAQGEAFKTISKLIR